ncbi:hypothetical protein L907_00260 [Agrobacterium sp. C13]|nr:hypothetical protein L906_00260 [Agrobacterium sp. TS45]KVK68370.1 hypothetical protein L907_00260 [Agrobacterium sp. C13]
MFLFPAVNANVSAQMRFENRMPVFIDDSQLHYVRIAG